MAQTGVSYVRDEPHMGVVSASPAAQVHTGKHEMPEPGSYRLINVPASCAALLISQRLKPFAKLSNECHAIQKLL